MPKFSANLGFLWTELPLLERMEAAHRAGFKAIEFHWPYETPATEVRATANRLGMTLVGLNTLPGDLVRGEFGLAAIPGRNAEFKAHLQQSVQYCEDAGISAIHVMAGVTTGLDTNLARLTFVENLKYAADMAARQNLVLLLEPINQRDKPGYFYSNISKAAEIIGAVGASNVKIMFDTYHVGVSEGDICKRMEAYLPLIGHIQIAAVPSRAEPDEGEISYSHVLAEMDRLDYKGWVGCEYKPRAGTEAGLGWMKEAGFPLK